MHYLEDLIKNNLKDEIYGLKDGWKPLFDLKGKKRVNILGLGDVGGFLLTGLKLLGGDVISSIGIYNNGNVAKRYENEMNQISYPWDYNSMPEVEIIEKNKLFDCDVFVFCASKAVPAVGADVSDVRMVQFDENRNIIKEYAVMAREKSFQGLFAVVSDPVDPLCKAAYLYSNMDKNGTLDLQGLKTNQVKGYGLGVMNSRAAYFAKKDVRFKSFLSEGRAFGPHGSGLVIANSIEFYDDELSRELTQLTIESNLKTRELGFKPFIAPALSSGAISLLLTMRGEWHYSSSFLGGVYLGLRNKITEYGVEMESLPLPESLFRRIEEAYLGLKKII